MGWKKISKFKKNDRFEHFDIWMQVTASPLTMGLSDSFRVPDAFHRDGAWYHRVRGEDKKLNSDYITHWRKRPKGPSGERDY